MLTLKWDPPWAYLYLLLPKPLFMATATTSPPVTAVQPALLFMPDITGFTRFVTNTEIEHAQSIIKEVLEVLIESNQLGLEVSEIEGDAVFFYRLGGPPSFGDLIQQVQTMFTHFHHHLKLYEQQRICNCQACAAACGLKLKIFAHYGEVTGYSVHQRQQLFGTDVIIIHRLLKNSLNKQEYALLTHPLMSSLGEQAQLPPWYVPEEARESYDTGDIDFTLVDLTELYQQLPPLEPPQYHPTVKTKTVLTAEKRIPAPAPQVFIPIFNLSQRLRWMDGVTGIEMVSKHQINRIGTRHRCVFSPEKNYVMVTEYAHLGPQEAELVEMEAKKLAGCRYRVQAISDTESNVVMEFLLRKNPFLEAYFNLFLKKKEQRSMAHSLDNLYHLYVETGA